MTNQKMCPLVCEQAPHLGESREFTRERHAEGDGKELSFNCNMLLCVICQKFYSRNPVMVYFGNGILQWRVLMVQGWVKPFKPTWIHNYNYYSFFLSILLIFELLRRIYQYTWSPHCSPWICYSYFLLGNFYFSFVSTLWGDISIPKKKRKRKITWD